MDNAFVRDKENAGCIIEYMRKQRHDFMNHIQVIWGYMQLKKYEKAADYIKHINKRYDVYGDIYRIQNPLLSLSLYSLVREAYKNDIDIDMEIETDSSVNNFFDSGYENIAESMIKLFNYIIGKTQQKSDKIIYIDVYTEDNKLYITFSNNINNEVNIYGNNREDELAKTVEEFKGLNIDISYSMHQNDLALSLIFCS
ncbi:MAG TPA: hypothetical protein DD426_08380 [Clostridiaceae bacterium]|nr:hypothetical protein [Clostridiaceae bacterium]